MRFAVLLATVLLVAGCDSNELQEQVCDDADLTVEDVRVGNGQAANPNSTVGVFYIGSLTDGSVFDSTRTVRDSTGFRASTTFRLPNLVTGVRFGIGGTAGTILPDIAPMRVGGRRIITVPPNLGYGGFAREDSDGNVLIPACSTLLFDIDLVGI